MLSSMTAMTLRMLCYTLIPFGLLTWEGGQDSEQVFRQEGNPPLLVGDLRLSEITGPFGGILE